jgi:hypothetical protein
LRRRKPKAFPTSAQSLLLDEFPASTEIGHCFDTPSLSCGHGSVLNNLHRSRTVRGGSDYRVRKLKALQLKTSRAASVPSVDRQYVWTLDDVFSAAHQETETAPSETEALSGKRGFRSCRQREGSFSPAHNPFTSFNGASSCQYSSAVDAVGLEVFSVGSPRCI